MSEPAVLFQNVSKYYKLYDSPRDRLKEALHPFGRKRHREFYALKNVDLEIPKGEILGIVGRNGSGKSTLLKIIAGVIPINSGRVTIHGKVSALLDLGVGMNPEFDGIQNIHFGGLMLGIPHDEMKRRIDDIVAFADIGDFIRQPLKTYSSGMRARLGFALAVHIDPEILVVDEVLAVGDELFKRKCYARMEAMLRSGCTVIYVTHNIHTVTELCTRAVLLDNGELLLDGPPKLVTDQYQRLLFAEPKRMEGIRTEILLSARDGRENVSKIHPDAPIARPAQALPVPAPASRPDSPARVGKALFIPELVPKSTIEYRNKDVQIAGIQMRTTDGERVNVLQMNEEYVFSYQVSFGVLAKKVFFSMAIKTEKGIELTWAYTQRDHLELTEVSPGDEFQVDWRFRCSLAPGTYYTNIGVREMRDDEPHILNRIVDASAFKVQKPPSISVGGYFHVDQEASIHQIHSADDA